VKRSVIGLLGMVLAVAGCALFFWVGQTATYAMVYVGQGGYQGHSPYNPTYPLAQQMGQLWSPQALVYVNLYLSVLAVCLGATLVLLSIRGLRPKDGAKHSEVAQALWGALGTVLLSGVVLATSYAVAVSPPTLTPVDLLLALSPCIVVDLLALSLLLALVAFTLKSRSGSAIWGALLIALVIGVVLANLSGVAFPPRDPCFGVLNCPPWNPGPFGPPMWMLLHAYPLEVLAVMAMSVLLSLVGFVLALRGRSAQTAEVVRGFQLAPILVATLIGLAALFLFPLPYTL